MRGPSPLRSTGPALTSRNRLGAALAVLAGCSEVAGAALIDRPPADGAGPPAAVLVLAVALGLTTVFAAVAGYVRDSRAALRVAAAALVVTVLAAVPAFLVPGVPTPLVARTALSVALGLLTVALLVSRR